MLASPPRRAPITYPLIINALHTSRPSKLSARYIRILQKMRAPNFSEQVIQFTVEGCSNWKQRLAMKFLYSWMICFSDRSIEKGKIESICKTKGNDLMVNLWFLEKNYTLLMVVYLQEKLNKWLIAHTNWPKTIFWE